MSIRARRRSVNAAGYVPRVGPPEIPQALATWWAGDLAFADGADVTSWVDRVAARTLAPGANSNPNPYATMKTSAIAGNPAVAFTAYDHGLVADGITFPANTGSIVVVCNYNASGKVFEMMNASVEETGIGFEMTNSDFTFSTVRNKTSSLNAAITAEQADFNDTPCIIEISSPVGTLDSAVTLVLRINNEIIHTYYPSAPVAQGVWTSLSQLVLGATRFNGPGFFEYASSSVSAVTDLEIAFVGVYDDQLTEANRSIIYNWLEAHYEIPCATYAADTTYFPPPVTNALGIWWANDLLSNTENTQVSWNNRLRSKNLSGVGPLFRQKGFFGKPGAYFPGNARITNSTPYANSSGSVVMIVEFDAINNGALWSQTRSSSDNYYNIGLVSSAGQIETHERNNLVGTFDRVRGGSVMTTATRYMLEWTSSGSLYSHRIDDVAETPTVLSGSNTGHWWSVPTSMNRLTVGVRYGSTTGTFFNGRIAYMAFTSAPISSTDRAAILSWANGYYGSGNAAPVGVINVVGGNTSVEKDLPITFNSTGSYDPDGTIASYAWDFDNGITSTSASPAAVTFTSYGTYDVTLTLTDNKGLTSVTTQTITVTPNVPPVAAYTYSGPAAAPADITFNASTSSDPTGPGSHALTYAWDFDNGDTATGVTPTETFLEGSYDVVLTVTDDLGGTDTETQTLTIGPDPGPPPSPTDTVAKWWANSVASDAGNSFGLVVPPSDASDRWVDSVASLTLTQDPDPFTWTSSGLNGRNSLTYGTATASGLASYSSAGSVFLFFKKYPAGGIGFNFIFTAGSNSLTLQASENGGLILTDIAGAQKVGVFTTSSSLNYYLVEIGSTGSAHYARVNDSAVSLTNPYFPTYGNLTADWSNDLGSPTGTTYLSWGDNDLGFVMVTSSVPTGTDRTNLVNWINSYYGITLGTS